MVFGKAAASSCCVAVWSREGGHLVTPRQAVADAGCWLWGWQAQGSTANRVCVPPRCCPQVRHASGPAGGASQAGRVHRAGVGGGRHLPQALGERPHHALCPLTPSPDPHPGSALALLGVQVGSRLAHPQPVHARSHVPFPPPPHRSRHASLNSTALFLPSPDESVNVCVCVCMPPNAGQGQRRAGVV